MAVRADLYAIGEARSHIADEFLGGGNIPATDHPRHHELAIGVDSGPGPYVSSIAGSFHFRGCVLVLGVDEAPTFIALDAFAVEVAQCTVLIFSTADAHLAKTLGKDI